MGKDTLIRQKSSEDVVRCVKLLSEYKTQRITQKKQASTLISSILQYIDLVLEVCSNIQIAKKRIFKVFRYLELVEEIINGPNAPILKKAFVREATQKIFEMYLDDENDSWCKRQMLRKYNSCVNGSPKDVRKEIAEELPFHMYRLVDSLSVAGSFDLQWIVMETIFRIYSTQILSKSLKYDIIPSSPDLDKAIKQISTDNFDKDVRTFLNKYNENSTRVFSILCRFVTLGDDICQAPSGLDEESQLWVDFSLSMGIISWCYDTNDGSLDQLTILSGDVTNVKVERSRDNTKIIIQYKNTLLSEKIDTKPYLESVEKNIKLIINNENSQLTKLISHVLPNMFKGCFQHTSQRVASAKRSVYKPLSMVKISPGHRRSSSGASSSSIKKSSNSSSVQIIEDQKYSYLGASANANEASIAFSFKDIGTVSDVTSPAKSNDAIADFKQAVNETSGVQEKTSVQEQIVTSSQPWNKFNFSLDNECLSVQEDIEILSGRCSGNIIDYSKIVQKKVRRKSQENSEENTGSSYYETARESLTEKLDKGKKRTVVKEVTVKKNKNETVTTKVSKYLTLPNVESVPISPRKNEKSSEFCQGKARRMPADDISKTGGSKTSHYIDSENLSTSRRIVRSPAENSSFVFEMAPESIAGSVIAGEKTSQFLDEELLRSRDEIREPKADAVSRLTRSEELMEREMKKSIIQQSTGEAPLLRELVAKIKDADRERLDARDKVVQNEVGESGDLDQEVPREQPEIEDSLEFETTREQPRTAEQEQSEVPQSQILPPEEGLMLEPWKPVDITRSPLRKRPRSSASTRKKIAEHEGLQKVHNLVPTSLRKQSKKEEFVKTVEDHLARHSDSDAMKKRAEIAEERLEIPKTPIVSPLEKIQNLDHEAREEIRNLDEEATNVEIKKTSKDTEELEQADIEERKLDGQEETQKAENLDNEKKGTSNETEAQGLEIPQTQIVNSVPLEMEDQKSRDLELESQENKEKRRLKRTRKAKIAKRRNDKVGNEEQLQRENEGTSKDTEVKPLEVPQSQIVQYEPVGEEVQKSRHLERRLQLKRKAKIVKRKNDKLGNEEHLERDNEETSKDNEVQPMEIPQTQIVQSAPLEVEVQKSLDIEKIEHFEKNVEKVQNLAHEDGLEIVDNEISKDIEVQRLEIPKTQIVQSVPVETELRENQIFEHEILDERPEMLRNTQDIISNEEILVTEEVRETRESQNSESENFIYTKDLPIFRDELQESENISEDYSAPKESVKEMMEDLPIFRDELQESENISEDYSAPKESVKEMMEIDESDEDNIPLSHFQSLKKVTEEEDIVPRKENDGNCATENVDIDKIANRICELVDVLGPEDFNADNPQEQSQYSQSESENELESHTIQVEADVHVDAGKTPPNSYKKERQLYVDLKKSRIYSQNQDEIIEKPSSLQQLRDVLESDTIESVIENFPSALNRKHTPSSVGEDGDIKNIFLDTKITKSPTDNVFNELFKEYKTKKVPNMENLDKRLNKSSSSDRSFDRMFPSDNEDNLEENQVVNMERTKEMDMAKKKDAVELVPVEKHADKAVSKENVEEIASNEAQTKKLQQFELAAKQDTTEIAPVENERKKLQQIETLAKQNAIEIAPVESQKKKVAFREKHNKEIAPPSKEMVLPQTEEDLSKMQVSLNQTTSTSISRKRKRRLFNPDDDIGDIDIVSTKAMDTMTELSQTIKSTIKPNYEKTKTKVLERPKRVPKVTKRRGRNSSTRNVGMSIMDSFRERKRLTDADREKREQTMLFWGGINAEDIKEMLSPHEHKRKTYYEKRGRPNHQKNLDIVVRGKPESDSSDRDEVPLKLRLKKAKRTPPISIDIQEGRGERSPAFSQFFSQSQECSPLPELEIDNSKMPQQKSPEFVVAHRREIGENKKIKVLQDVVIVGPKRAVEDVGVVETKKKKVEGGSEKGNMEDKIVVPEMKISPEEIMNWVEHGTPQYSSDTESKETDVLGLLKIFIDGMLQKANLTNHEKSILKKIQSFLKG